MIKNEAVAISSMNIYFCLNVKRGEISQNE